MIFFVNERKRGEELAVLWKENVNVKVKSFSVGYIDTIINTEVKGTDWRKTGFYDIPITIKRHYSWQLLKKLATMGNFLKYVSRRFQ